MTESKGERAAPTTPPAKPTEADTCPDPIKPYTDYRVDVSVAAKRSELYTADKEKVDEKYGKLGDAQKRFADAWKERQKPWEGLKCQLERIEKALKLDPDEKKHLQQCWDEEVAKTDNATKPANCDEISDDEKTNCEKLPTEIGELRRLEDLAAKCVTRYDTEFDELAGFPEKLGDQITALTERATTLEDATTALSDLRRSYVEYLALHRDFCKLNNRLPPTAADYACKLKVAFDILLKTHKKSICLQVAVYKWDERQKLEEEAEREKAGKLVDSVLECALKKPAHAGTSPEKPDEHGSGSTSKPDHEATGDKPCQGSETTAAGADC